MAKKDKQKLLNTEEHLMRLLDLKSVDELHRVLSEPPNEQSLQEMGPPDDLYDLEWEDDLIDSALDEIERTERDGTDAIFVTKGGAIAMGRIPTPPPSESWMVREFSCGTNTISSGFVQVPLWEIGRDSLYRLSLITFQGRIEATEKFEL